MNRSISDWGGNILAFVLVIVVNVLANALPLGGQTTGQVSAAYSSLFTPAGYVFSIWGLIYAGLTAFIVYQALPAQRSNPRLAAMHIAFVANCVANAVWLFLWHYDLITASLAAMVVILATLVWIYRALDIGRSAVTPAERWLVHLPFSLYTAWITVATIANLSSMQAARGWAEIGFDEMTWTVIKIAVAGAIAATVLFRRRDIAFVLVVVWAGAGIAVKQAATPMVVGAAATVAVLGILLVATETVTRQRS